MDEAALGPAAGPLQRARLHIRGGKRRLAQGKIAAGIVTLYDALDGAMQWYVSSAERLASLRTTAGEDLNDERTLFKALQRSGVIDNTFDYEAFDSLVEEALRKELTDYDYRPLLASLEKIMTGLGVMPFDETSLPPEDPATF
jgi:hypothetical protein